MSEQATITHDDVRAIAELAKLAVSDDEVPAYAQQLTSILEYFTLLQEVDTSQIAPTASVLPITNVLREDTPQPPLSPGDVIANAADAEANQFRVSAVLDE